MTLEVNPVWDVDGDRVVVYGVVTDDAGQKHEVQGAGWVSAMENHFAPEQYDTRIEGLEGLHRSDDAKSRHMTPAECEEYARRLILEQNGLGLR